MISVISLLRLYLCNISPIMRKVKYSVDRGYLEISAVNCRCVFVWAG